MIEMWSLNVAIGHNACTVPITCMTRYDCLAFALETIRLSHFFKLLVPDIHILFTVILFCECVAHRWLHNCSATSESLNFEGFLPNGIYIDTVVVFIDIIFMLVIVATISFFFLKKQGKG